MKNMTSEGKDQALGFPTSDLRSLTSDLGFPTSDLRSLTSDL